MSKIGRQPNPQAFIQQQQQSRPAEAPKSKSSSGTSSTSGSSSSSSSGTGNAGASAKSSSKQAAGSLDELPNVGLDTLGGVDVVDSWKGGAGAQAYANDAADQHNQIGAKAARGELISQQGTANPQNQALRRQVDTLKARLQSLEEQLGGTSQTNSTQGVQRVASPAARQVGRAFGAEQNTQQSSVKADNIQAVGEKQPGLLDDDLPRVGLRK